MVLLLAVSVSGLGVCVGECTGWRSWLGPPPCDDDVDEGTHAGPLTTSCGWDWAFARSRTLALRRTGSTTRPVGAGRPALCNRVCVRG
jgi:hypothetical protein